MRYTPADRLLFEAAKNDAYRRIAAGIDLLGLFDVGAAEQLAAAVGDLLSMYSNVAKMLAELVAKHESPDADLIELHETVERDARLRIADGYLQLCEYDTGAAVRLMDAVDDLAATFNEALSAPMHDTEEENDGD